PVLPYSFQGNLWNATYGAESVREILLHRSHHDDGTDNTVVVGRGTDARKDPITDFGILHVPADLASKTLRELPVVNGMSRPSISHHEILLAFVSNKDVTELLCIGIDEEAGLSEDGDPDVVWTNGDRVMSGIGGEHSTDQAVCVDYDSTRDGKKG